MKTKLLVPVIVSSFCILHASFTARAATTIDAANKYAYGANVGWMDWRGDINTGAVIGEYVCSGYIYAANVGWINLGSGTPTNSIYYQNLSAGDFGVNQDGLGNLRGYAYGANIGWINFEATGAAKVDLFTGKFSGYAYSANCGWISLSNALALVQTDSIQQGPLAPNGLPIPWLVQNFGTTNVNANADSDLDGQSNLQEYLAGTNPNNAASVLRITSITRGTPTLTYATLQWTSVPTRFYVLQERTSLTGGAWADYINFPVAGWNNVGFDDFNNPNDFFRVRAYRPLTP
jgi:hypothetical protein